MEREKYPTNSGGAYELMICSSGRYKSIGNSCNRGRRWKSNGCGNQQNQRQNIMFLQQDSNGGNSNGCPPDYKIVTMKDGSAWFIEWYYCREWGHI